MRPWLGDELAYAAVSPTDSVVLAAVADRPRAEALVARVGNLSAAEQYRGVRVLLAGTTAIAFVGGYLAVGTEAAVRAAVDREQGEGDRLADRAAFRRTLDGAPAGRTLTAYASADGVRQVLVPRAGLLGTLGALLGGPGLTGRGRGADRGGGRAARPRAAGRRGARGRGVRARAARARPEPAVAYLGVRGALRLVRLLDRLGAGADGRRGSASSSPARRASTSTATCSRRSTASSPSPSPARRTTLRQAAARRS